jgi:cobaltochelatase CobN
MSVISKRTAQLWMALLACIAVLCLPAPAIAQPEGAGKHMVIIPGDSSIQQTIAAVEIVKADPAFAGVTFKLLPQALLEAADKEALLRADVVVARHMVGDIGEQLVPEMETLAARGVKRLGAGSNDGAPARLGLVEDLTLRAYFDAGGADNLANMIRLVAKREFGLAVEAIPPKALPQVALWEPHGRTLHEDFESFAAAYSKAQPNIAERPWVGVVINRGQALESRNEAVDAIVSALETRGFNVAPAFGYPSQVPVEKLLIDAEGKARVEAVVALGMKTGNIPDRIVPVLERLDVPVVNAITLYKASRAEWEASPVGLDIGERSWQIANPEFAGMQAPTVIASKERRLDAATGLEYVAEVPIPERIERLADRVQMLLALRTRAPSQKRVAVIYYNSPPGKENVGATYLNVMPRSLWQILGRLERDGYDLKGRPANEDHLFDRLQKHGTNIGSWSPGALSALVASGEAFLLPMADYRAWFDAQPAALRDEMTKAWGHPEDFKVMVWRDAADKAFFVFPGQRFGNILFAPQPARGWGEVTAQYHDVKLPPHHQYLAFYLWLQKGFAANAMVHVGTHGTYEWLSGKEVGFTAADPSEAMVGAVPQVYPYIVDVVGEGLQAKRRGAAVLISHMTPPFAVAGLSPDLKLLKGLLDDHTIAAGKSESAAAAKLGELNVQAQKIGILKDLGLTELRTNDDAEHLHEYLEKLALTQSPMGMHTFGVAPGPELRLSTAEAMVARLDTIAPDQRGQQIAEFADLQVASAAAELDALSAALAGRYVAAGPGGDPLRNPASLPTGRNLYGFDPARMPSKGVYDAGEKLAAGLVADYRNRHAEYPDRLLFTLWSGETMRHEGLLEAQIMALMGVRPRWDSFGRVTGVDVVARETLGRPRVDVIITPSGLYRDTLPNIMMLLDKAVSAVRGLDEPDNAVRANVVRVERELIEQGTEPELAKRIASVRLFTPPSGAYGNGLENVILAGNTWSTEEEVIDVYFRYNSHLFGQGFWGDQPGGAAASQAVFKSALRDVKAVLHSRASNLYGTLDNDDVYQYLGGSAMAVRAVNGKTPETLLVDMGNPGDVQTLTLDQFMGREMRTRYLNPKWIDAMLNEGYAGARFVKQVTDNLWGWQVTVPEAVDAAKWQEMYETYVADKHNLNIRQRFRDAKNMLAYQAMVDRMLVAVNKGYWKADAKTIAALDAANEAAIREAGVACSAASCSSQKVTEMAQAIDRRATAQAVGFGLQAPAAGALPTAAKPAEPSVTPPSSAPAAAPAPPKTQPSNIVRGQQLAEQPLPRRIEQALNQYYGLLILLLIALGIGWQALRLRRDTPSLRPAFN